MSSSLMIFIIQGFQTIVSGSKFNVRSQVQQETSEKGQRTYQPKRYEYKNKDEDNSLKTLNDKYFILHLRLLSKFFFCLSLFESL